MNTFSLFIALFTAHLAGDFLLQTESDVRNKLKPVIFFKHIFILTALSYFLCGLWDNWFIPAGIFLSHMLIDYTKEKFFVKKESSHRKRFAIFLSDQSLHVLSILLIAHYTVLYFISPGQQLNRIDQLLGMSYITILIILGGTILITRTGGIIIDILIQPYLTQMQKPGSGPGLYRGFENGGRLIGYLERIIIFVFILTNNLAGIGFLIAAKSIFRFGEISRPENRMETEYIIIGTFYSFSWAILTGHLIKFVVDL
jgi:predicted neutral ceramidase superfamily lipid hydrolase